MKLWNIFGVGSYTVMGIVLASASVAAAAAQEWPTHGINNVLLVHGAWADGSSWSKVIPLLQAKGLHVVAVQLPLTSLAADVATTERALALENGPVLLVGHSYGGAVITEAGNNSNVAALVFVAAYAPDEGESALSLATANPTPVGSELRPDPTGMFYKLSLKGILEDFAQDLPEIERATLFVTQGPTGAAALGSPITDPAWKNKPTWFIVAGQDRIISPELEEMEAKRMDAVTIRLNTSHVAMLSDPTRVADFIAQAAEHGRDH
ncbi:MAG TPA: alpha/beta hydrolase [Bryobacteraceae bacterium]|jgi:pimeloyl-ACP methyl ester carboxylesterase|nr:alpha/beta hydrolase [Bryobacteraceae bacterium]